MHEYQLNWPPPAPHANSLYALAVHTIGNAKENILFTLADRASPGHHEQEFAAQGQSADALVVQWQGTRDRLQQALLSLSADDVVQEHLHPRRGCRCSW